MRRGLDTLLFNLLVLGCLCDRMGRVWRRRSTDLYIVEVTTAAPLPMGFTREEEAQIQGVSKIAKECEFYFQILHVNQWIKAVTYSGRCFCPLYSWLN